MDMAVEKREIELVQKISALASAIAKLPSRSW
jgi:hypothetical protein